MDIREAIIKLKHTTIAETGDEFALVKITLSKLAFRRLAFDCLKMRDPGDQWKSWKGDAYEFFGVKIEEDTKNVL